MEDIKRAVYRASGKITDMILLSAILSFLLALAGQLLAELLFRITDAENHLTRVLGNRDAVAFLLLYFTFIGIWIMFFLVISVFRDNRPMWSCLAFRRGGNSLPAALAGLFGGFAANGFCVLMSVIRGDVKLSWSGFDPVFFFAFLFVVTVQSGGEEIVDRCYLYQKLRRRYRHPAVAVLGNALVFMALHLGNDNLTVVSLLQILLVGILMSLFVYYYDCLWAAIMFHAGWNFTQNIVFGLPNSGVVSQYSLFKLDAAAARNGLFYNVGFGVEGSVGASVLLAALVIAVLVINRGKREKRDLWREMEDKQLAAMEVRKQAVNEIEDR